MEDVFGCEKAVKEQRQFLGRESRRFLGAEHLKAYQSFEQSEGSSGV